jgi:hypothetical protein
VILPVAIKGQREVRLWKNFDLRPFYCFHESQPDETGASTPRGQH